MPAVCTTHPSHKAQSYCSKSCQRFVSPSQTRMTHTAFASPPHHNQQSHASAVERLEHTHSRTSATTPATHTNHSCSTDTVTITHGHSPLAPGLTRIIPTWVTPVRNVPSPCRAKASHCEHPIIPFRPPRCLSFTVHRCLSFTVHRSQAGTTRTAVLLSTIRARHPDEAKASGRSASRTSRGARDQITSNRITSCTRSTCMEAVRDHPSPA